MLRGFVLLAVAQTITQKRFAPAGCVLRVGLNMKIYSVLICSFVVCASDLAYAEPERSILGSAQTNEACSKNHQSGGWESLRISLKKGTFQMKRQR